MIEMFENSRYVTRGVTNEIPLEIQLILWQLIDKKKQEFQKMDYLQIFELSEESSGGLSVQKVIHSQEKPPFEEIQHINTVSFPMNCIIWVIDDGEHTTMLFPEEYWPLEAIWKQFQENNLYQYETVIDILAEMILDYLKTFPPNDVLQTIPQNPDYDTQITDITSEKPAA